MFSHVVLFLILLQDVTVFLPEWEDGHFYLAKYYDKLMPMVTDNKMEKQGDLIRYIVHHFGRLGELCLVSVEGRLLY